MDPSSLFCLLPSDPSIEPRTETVGAGVTALGVLGGLVLLVILTVAGMVTYNSCVCEKGDYVCDSSEDIPEEHGGAWDNPSADVFKGAEEDIVFTHLQIEERSRSISYSRPFSILDHHNLAYVDEEIPAEV